MREAVRYTKYNVYDADSIQDMVNQRQKGIDMGFLGNFVDGIKNKNNNEIDDYLDDEFYDEEEDYDDNDSDWDDGDYEEAPKSGIFSGFSKRGKSQASNEQPRSGGVFSRKVVPIQQPNMEVTLVRPKNNQDDWKDLCDDLLDGKAVILNLDGIDDRTAQRIIDQTLGAIYSIGGDLQRISNYIFIATPKTIALTGAFKDNSSSDSYRNSERPQQRAAGGYGF